MKVLCSIALLLVAQVMGMNVPKSGIVPSGSEGRIINGQEATPNEYPWVVWLSVNTLTGGYSCTGSLIYPQWVLTAGHCQQNVRSTDVYLGAHNVKSTTEGHTIVRASAGIVHPDYNANTLKGDIALIKLPSPVDVTGAKIKTINLDERNTTIDRWVGQRVVISGWGKTSDASNVISDTLQKGTVTVIPNAECQSAFPLIIREGKICTTGGSNSTGAMGTCNGDSGSALFTQVPSGEIPIQIGVTSFVSSAGCESGFPDGFTNVAIYRQWIDETIAANP